MSEGTNAHAITSFSPAQIEATAESALGVVEEAGARGVVLVETWVKRGNAAAVATVAEAGSGKTRKAARRGLNVLKARGVAIPQTRRIARLGNDEAEETVEAFLLAPDTAGNVFLVVSARAPSSRCRSASVVLNDTFGLHRIESGEMSQSQLKATMARALPSAEYKAVSVPVEWARWRIDAARRRHESRGAPLPLGLDTALPLLQPLPETAPSHPLDEEGLVLSDADASELAKTSGRLHALPEFRGWFPSRQAVEEMMLKVGETLTPGQEPDQAELQQTIAAQIEAATDRYFSPERRERLVALMKDSALSVLARVGEQRCLEVVAAMKAIESAGLITNPPHEVPFLRAYFDKAVAVMVAQGGGQLRIPIPARPAPPVDEHAEPAVQPEQPTSTPDGQD